MIDYQSLAGNARTRLLAVLASVGLEPDELDELVCAIESGAVAGSHCWVVEEFFRTPEGRSTEYGTGWSDGVTAAVSTLVAVADSTYRQRGRALTTRTRTNPCAQSSTAPTESTAMQ